MQLKEDWKKIIKKAWSVRLVAVSAVFSAAEVVIPLYGDLLPRDTFAIISVIACMGAIIARVIAQKDLHDE